jgi:hypothetical protein
MKFPKTLFVTKDKESDGTEFLLACEHVPENDNDVVAEYRIVRKGKISIQVPQVDWNKP